MTTDVSHLSSNAQSLLAALQQTAQAAAQSRGVGYAQLHEDLVGGLGQPAPDPGNFAPDDEGAAAYRAAVEKHVMKDARAAVEELNANGFEVRISAGERDRMIALENYRLAVKR